MPMVLWTYPNCWSMDCFLNSPRFSSIRAMRNLHSEIYPEKAITRYQVRRFHAFLSSQHSRNGSKQISSIILSALSSMLAQSVTRKCRDSQRISLEIITACQYILTCFGGELCELLDMHSIVREPKLQDQDGQLPRKIMWELWFNELSTFWSILAYINGNSYAASHFSETQSSRRPWKVTSVNCCLPTSEWSFFERVESTMCSNAITTKCDLGPMFIWIY